MDMFFIWLIIIAIGVTELCFILVCSKSTKKEIKEKWFIYKLYSLVAGIYGTAGLWALYLWVTKYPLSCIWTIIGILAVILYFRINYLIARAIK